MGVDATHPAYDRISENWKLMRDAAEGTIAIKDWPEEYLPMPTGFQVQEDGGAAEYANYVARAQFPGDYSSVSSGHGWPHPSGACHHHLAGQAESAGRARDIGRPVAQCPA
jgi:hypothetical protein